MEFFARGDGETELIEGGEADKGEGRTAVTTEDIGYYDYRPVTLLFACFISFQRYALS